MVEDSNKRSNIMWGINGAITGLALAVLFFFILLNNRLEYVEAGPLGDCHVLSIEPTDIQCPKGKPIVVFGFLYVGDGIFCKEYIHRIPDKFVTDYKCFIREP